MRLVWQLMFFFVMATGGCSGPMGAACGEKDDPDSTVILSPKTIDVPLGGDFEVSLIATSGFKTVNWVRSMTDETVATSDDSQFAADDYVTLVDMDKVILTFRCLDQVKSTPIHFEWTAYNRGEIDKGGVEFNSGTMYVNCIDPNDVGGFHATDATDDQVCTGDSNDPASAATDIVGLDVVEEGSEIVATLTFAGNIEMYDQETVDRLPVSLQFQPKAGGPHPEIFFDTKVEIKMSILGQAISYLLSGTTLVLRATGFSLDDMEGVRASTYPYRYDASGTLECTDELTDGVYSSL